MFHPTCRGTKMGLKAFMKISNSHHPGYELCFTLPLLSIFILAGTAKPFRVAQA
jgi:hypothetical protein